MRYRSVVVIVCYTIVCYHMLLIYCELDFSFFYEYVMSRDKTVIPSLLLGSVRFLAIATCELIFGGE